jgi:hypothetical protein
MFDAQARAPRQCDILPAFLAPLPLAETGGLPASRYPFEGITMSRLLLRVIVSGLALLASAAVIEAQAPPAAPLTAPAPVLLTSCGQSPGPVKLQVFLKRLGIDHEYKTDATVKDLAAKKFKSLIIVTGTSLKGMGAAGVSMTDELKRTEALIAEARKQGIVLIGAHVEGMERRAKNAAPGDNSDEQSIDAVCPVSRLMIVRKDGDEDGRFTAISKAKKIPLITFEKNTDLSDVLKSLFGK